MTLFDRLVAASLPLVPKPIVGAVSKRYIAGETLGQAVATVRELNAQGAMATLDVLGEDTTDRRQAEELVAEYERAIAAIREHGLDCNVSIKLTAFGLKLDSAFCRAMTARVVAAAAAARMFVRIDMEDSGVTSETLAICRELRERYENVGPVIQAYLRRTLADARELLAGPALNVRLCKGIYNEPAAVAFKDRDVVRRSYQNLLEVLLRGGAYVGIATHDELLVYEGLRLVDQLGLKRDQYEFQMLLGVVPELRRSLIAAGHRLRVYVPFGRNWYGYSVRRLKENPRVAGYVFKAILAGGGR